MSTSANENPRNRERHRANVRRDITEAAFQLFLDRGLADTSVEDIVTLAGVSRRTFYRYFPSASAIITHWSQAVAERLEAEAASLSADKPMIFAARDALRTVMTSYEMERDRAFTIFHVLDRVELQSHHSAMFTMLGLHLAKGLVQRDGGNASLEQCSLCAGIVVGIVRTAVEQWSIGETDRDLADLLDDAFVQADRLYLHALLARAEDLIR